MDKSTLIQLVGKNAKPKVPLKLNAFVLRSEF